jgi:hypothetical protein
VHVIPPSCELRQWRIPDFQRFSTKCMGLNIPSLEENLKVGYTPKS